jgi:hypothetical protein
MNQRIRHLIRNPFEVQLADVTLLQDEIEKYPYFSTLRTLLLFALKEHGHPTYLNELKKTGIYCPSRVALYHYLQKEQRPAEIQEPRTFQTDAATLQTTEVENSTENAPKSSVEIQESIEPIVVPEETTVPEAETTPQPMLPSQMTFSEWLSLSPVQTDTATSESPTEKDIKYKLIDEFIEKSPKILSVDKNDEPVGVKNQAPTEYSDLMTETLARIYVEQKKYDKALRAYKILSLKYPDKKDFFEEQIRQIESLGNFG